MTINEILEEYENFTSSKEYFDLYKEAAALDVAELWLEHQCYLEFQDKSDENFNESYFIEEASNETTQKVAKETEKKKDGFFKNIWNKIKGLFNTIIGFFKGLWNRISGASEDVKTQVETAITENDVETLKNMAKVSVTVHKRNFGKMDTLKNFGKSGYRYLKGKISPKKLNAMGLTDEETIAILSLYSGIIAVNPVPEEYKNAIEGTMLCEWLKSLFDGSVMRNNSCEAFIKKFNEEHEKIKNNGISFEYSDIVKIINRLEKYKNMVNSGFEDRDNSETKNNKDIIECYTIAMKSATDTIKLYKKASVEIIEVHKKSVKKKAKNEEE